MSVLAFDLDRTLVQHVGDILFDKPASLQEGCILDNAVADRVRRLVKEGHEVHVVTARDRHKVRGVTLQHASLVHPHLATNVHMQGTWVDYDNARRLKATKLKEIGAEVFVGDHLMDELAAEDAGVPFLHVDAFREGTTLPGLDKKSPGNAPQRRRKVKA